MFDQQTSEIANGTRTEYSIDTHRVPINEYDNDGDGYVECSIDINPAAWYSSQVQVEDVDGNYISGLKGGDDCNDDDIFDLY